MKIIKTVLLTLFIGMLAFSQSLGQEKKNEQKIKVVVEDKSGAKVVIDTTFNGAITVDSIMFKDGSVVYLSHQDMDHVNEPGNNHKITATIEKNCSKSSNQYVYINDDADKDISNISRDTFDIQINDDTLDNDTENTKFVIAKNGVTVSIEGRDETRVKEIAKEIEKDLDNIKEEPSSKPVVKETEKITTKKD
jgi:hypothetical protein